ncbi:MAG: Gfo/Idh/MocA family oxidoreductase [Alphaproteobacteria bacterium]|nr:Gfo/Idh/MocA family oxidoreductase [Alphaproteobacteria bacterium]
MKSVNVALLGACGWMGKCHSLGYRNAALLFPEKKILPNISWLVDTDEEKVKGLQPIYGDARISTDWRDAVADPAVDLVDICLPDQWHYEVSKAALLAGKHVYCEKPFTSTPAESAELAAMAAERGLVTRIGHNFPKNPVHDLTKEIIEQNEIGDLVLFRASMHVDVLANPETPFMWRCDGELTPTGVVGDVASHIFSYIQRLIGPIDELIADTVTTTETRPYVEGFGYGVVSEKQGSNETREVTNPDLVTLLCTFTSGGRGVIDVSRVASGRRFLQNYEIYGTKGGLEFRNDEVNRLRFFDGSDPTSRQGYRAIDVGPENPNFKAFLPVANFGLGYNEFKAIEVAEVVESVATGKPVWPTFADGHEIMKVVDACFRASRERRWVKV